MQRGPANGAVNMSPCVHHRNNEARVQQYIITQNESDPVLVLRTSHLEFLAQLPINTHMRLAADATFYIMRCLEPAEVNQGFIGTN